MPEGARFCPRCGADLNAAPPEDVRKKRRRKAAKKEIDRLGGMPCVTSANELAGFEMMYRDGLCETVPGVFSRTFEFSDISYEQERRDVQEQVFAQFCSFHAAFPEAVCYQINLVNFPNRRYGAERRIPEEGADVEWARAFNEIIDDRRQRGRVEYERRNYLTVAKSAEDAEKGNSQVSTVFESAKAALGRLGCRISELDGMDRMRMMHKLVRGTSAPFTFDYGRLERRGVRARDFVAPAWAAYVGDDRTMRSTMTLPGRLVRTYHIKDFGSDLSDRAIRTLRSLPVPMNISLLFRPQPLGKTVKEIRTNINVVQAEIRNYQKAELKSGVIDTRLPPAMEEREKDALDLLDFIRNDEQKVSYFQGLVTVFADNAEDMDRYDAMISDIKGQFSLDIVKMPLQQEQAFVSALPLATPRLDKRYRSLTTAESAAMIPFASLNIQDESKNSYFVGYDTVSGNGIYIDSDKLKSPHAWLFGVTGSGKSVQIKSMVSYLLLQYPRTELNERTECLESADPACPEVHIIDFHKEYGALGKQFGSPHIVFGPGHDWCLNPLALSDAEGNLTMHEVERNTDFFLAMNEAVLERKLTTSEKAIIDASLQSAYQKHIGKQTRPTLHTLYNSLKARGAKDETAKSLAEAWKIFVEGTFDSFSHETNFSTVNELTVYDMSEVGESMKTLAMLATLQHVRNRVFQNHKVGRPTFLLVEEVQILFNDDASVDLLDSYFSELRKYGLHILCITQLPSRVLAHKKATYLFENSGMFVFLPQNEKNADLLTETFSLSASQRERILPTAEAGTGIVIADGVKISFNNRIPKDNLLYGLWNTDPYRFAGAFDAPREDAE